MGINNPNRGWLETIILLIIFASIFAFMVNLNMREQKLFKQRSLTYELALLRQGVNLFILVDKRKPDNIVELATSYFSLPGENVKKKFVERVNLNEREQIVDPFGSPYLLDKPTGWVTSTSPGYTHW